MCLALLAINQHPFFPLMILSNRDEFYNRSSLPAHYWEDNPEIFAGKDLVGMGSWLGVNKHGSFALVTNFRDPAAMNTLKKSRGLLVKDYLESGVSPSAYIKKIAAEAADYNPFNLIVGNRTEIIYYASVDHQIKTLGTGIYGLSNAVLDSPWPKVDLAKELFSKLKPELLDIKDTMTMQALLFPILENKHLASDELLPETGVSFELEKALSVIFIDLPGYGTRSASVLLFGQQMITFAEKTCVDGCCELFDIHKVS